MEKAKMKGLKQSLVGQWIRSVLFVRVHFQGEASIDVSQHFVAV